MSTQISETAPQWYVEFAQASQTESEDATWSLSGNQLKLVMDNEEHICAYENNSFTMDFEGETPEQSSTVVYAKI